MAAAFIGTFVSVTLKNAQNTVIQGNVASVDQQTSTLTLRNVAFPSTGQTLQTYQVDGRAIADIKIEPTPWRQPPIAQFAQPPSRMPVSHSTLPPQHVLAQKPPPLHPTSNIPQSTSAQTTPTAAKPAHQTFADPAILSMGKRPMPRPGRAGQSPGLPSEAPSTPIKPMMEAAAAAVVPKITSPFVGRPPAPRTSSTASSRRRADPATLNAPFSGIEINKAQDELEDTDEPSLIEQNVRRASITKTRTGKPMDNPMVPVKAGAKGARSKKGIKKQVQQIDPTDTSLEMTRGGSGRGKGWRQTPILTNEPTNSPKTPGMIGGVVGQSAVRSSNRKTRKQRALESANGWATEDATDVQELPEFDFAENLAKFDKRSVFDQIRQDDTTADEDRLVSHNRLPPGQRKLLPTENVLDNPKDIRTLRKLSAEISDDGGFGSFDSAQGSRRNMSRASQKRLPQRHGSGVDSELHSQAISMSRSKSSITRHNSVQPAVYSSSHATGSPKPMRFTPPDSPVPLDQSTQSLGGLSQSQAQNYTGPHLVTSSTGRHVPTVTPGMMTAIEEVAEVDFGLSEEIMCENAARGIAEIVLSTINPGGRRLAASTVALNANPVIVVLAGNHRTGARAVAAARHLAARGARLLVFLLGFERGSSDWDKDVRRQVDVLQKMTGSSTVRGWGDVQAALKKLDAPPELIIDAMLGRQKEFEALGNEDQATVRDVVRWANASRASVLGVEGPSGVSGTTGEIPILEGEPLEVRAKYIVCLGAPRTGLLRTLENNASTGRDEPTWLLWVVDIGLNRPWRRAGLAGGKQGVPFGSEWVVGVKFEDGGEVDGQ